ncbi:hypothetical protein ACFY3U_00140 [Micromonospora sp. NPDC000089]
MTTPETTSPGGALPERGGVRPAAYMDCVGVLVALAVMSVLALLTVALR